MLSTHFALVLLLTLALLHGALYALYLPPWGLIDEAQHLHYIQYIAEHQALPVAGDLYLSDQIIDSLFATQRWKTFHWTPPPAPDPQVMGLEGYSYEAYQAPLFYLAMTPLYLALPADMLSKVYGLRIFVVLLSLATVGAFYRTAMLLWPHFPQLPFWGGLLLVAIPERGMATSRINNDVLLEVVAAFFFLTLTCATIAGLTRRRALLLGGLLGLAAWVKVSGGLLAIPLLLLLWQHRHSSHFWRSALWVLVAAPMGAALAIRNLWLYGDLTGFSVFGQLHRVAPLDFTFTSLMSSLASVPNHFWLVWWKGSEAGGNAIVTAFYLLMAVVIVVAWGRLVLHLWQRGDARQDAIHSLAWIYGITVLVYAGAVMGSYFGGMIPVVQGRFLLPAVLPFMLLLVWGLWLYRWREMILLAVVVILWGMGLFSLFGNLVPYYYYWSDVVAGTLTTAPMNVWEWLLTIYQRSLSDKPPALAPLLLVLPIVYGLALLYSFVVILQTMTPRQRWLVGRKHQSSPTSQLPTYPL